MQVPAHIFINVELLLGDEEVDQGEGREDEVVEVEDLDHVAIHQADVAPSEDQVEGHEVRPQDEHVPEDVVAHHGADHLQGQHGLGHDDPVQPLVLGDGEGGEPLCAGVHLGDGEVGPLEDGVITLVVAHEEVILEDPEEVDGAHLLLEL